MGEAFFPEVPGPIPFAGPDSGEPLAFAVYEPDRLVLGKRMADHLRIGVCLWHSFAWDGRDMFGVGTLDRPWLGKVYFVALYNRALSAEASGHAMGPEGSIAKLLWSETEQHVAETASLVLGPDALHGEWARNRVNSRSFTIAGGTTQVNKNIVAQRILGLPAG